MISAVGGSFFFGFGFHFGELHDTAQRPIRRWGPFSFHSQSNWALGAATQNLPFQHGRMGLGHMDDLPPMYGQTMRKIAIMNHSIWDNQFLGTIPYD